MTQNKNTIREPVDRTYTRDSDSAVLLFDWANSTIHGQWATRYGGAGQTSSQTITYDKAGRLTQVEDGCGSV
jgi:hypothetical protein